MTIFLIILAVLAVLIIAVLNLSATITVIYDKGWTTRLGVLFIERDIELSKILSFIMFPEKKAQEVNEKREKKKKNKTNTEAKAKAVPEKKEAPVSEAPKPKVDNSQKNTDTQEQKKPAPKANPIAKLWNDQGVLGILSLATNLVETANSAILTLIRGLHIYSLYVMIIVGGYDADFIAQHYGRICKYYYPVKGLILSSMKVDNYDDYVQPDFLASSTEFEMQIIASISVGLLLKVGLKAGIIFLKNLIKDKKSK